jgi:hypothetical protein
MADSNLTQLRYFEESTWGTGPTSDALQELRFTQESLKFALAFSKSAEIRDDRQIPELNLTGAECSGGFGFELTYGTYDDFFESALFSTFSSDLAISDDTITVAASGTTFTATTVDLFSDVVAGQWIKVSGFTETANNGYHQVTEKTSNLIIVLGNSTLSDEAAGDTITITGSVLRNGTTQKSFSIERYHSDLTVPLFYPFFGMIVNQMSLNFQSQSSVTGSFDFIGKNAGSGDNTSSMSSGSITAATTTEAFNCSADVGSFLKDGSSVDAELVKSFQFSLNNNVRGNPALGTLGFAGTGMGTCDVTGTIEAYLLDNSLYNAYKNRTAIGVSVRLTDPAGNTYIFTLPRIKINDNTINATGQNAEVMQSLPFQATRHTTYDCQIQIDKFAA